MKTTNRKMAMLKEEEIFRCPNCQKETEHRMTYCYIDVDERDSGGVPFLIGYKCNVCNHRKSHTRYFDVFEIGAANEEQS